MKRTAILTLILVLLITLLLVAFVPILKAVTETPQVEWSKTYPRPPAKTPDKYNITHIDGGSCFVQTSDGGYAIVGNIEDSVYRGEHTGGDQNYSGIIIKTDSSGNLQWQKTDSILLDSQSIFQTEDLGYMIVRGGYLLKMDAQGNIQSNKTFGVSVISDIQLSDGDYILAGNNWGDSLIMKFDGDGHLIWNKTLNALPTDEVSSNVVDANDGGYFIIGWTVHTYETAGVSSPNLWLIKTDSNGDTQFSKTYNFDDSLGGHRTNSAYLVNVFAIAIKDGGYLLAGGASFPDGGYTAPFLIKLDSQGNWMWYRTYATSSHSGVLSSVVQTTDGGFLIAGYYYPPSPLGYYQYTPLLLKTDSLGNVLWNKTFSSVEDYHFGSISSVLVTRDGGYAVMGSLDSSIWLAKFASESNPPPEETPPAISTTWIAIAMVILAAVGVGLLIYFKKRKQQAEIINR